MTPPYRIRLSIWFALVGGLIVAVGLFALTIFFLASWTPHAAVTEPIMPPVQRPPRLDRKTGAPMGVVEQCEFEQGVPDLKPREKLTPREMGLIAECVASKRYY
jgi:hypothetical protein